MSKNKIAILFFVLVFLFNSSGASYANGTYSISLRESEEILITSSNYGPNMRVLIEKGKERYHFSLNDQEEILPLQLGLGDYSIKILEHKQGNTYRVVYKNMVNLNSFNEKQAFLKSTQPVYWKEGQANDLAKKLTLGLNTDFEKLESIYKYIINNIDYDYDKIKNIKSEYVPNIEEILNLKSGICYDYAAVMAGMLRSLGIPTKLVKGYKKDLDVYHAWNEVLIEDKWVIIDTTYDTPFIKVNRAVDMVKNNIEYTKIKEY